LNVTDRLFKFVSNTVKMVAVARVGINIRKARVCIVTAQQTMNIY